MTQGTVDTGVVSRMQAATAEHRAAQHRQLETVADLCRAGVVAATGYRSERRLVEDALRVNPAEAQRLIRRARDLVPTVSLTGQILAPALPATAAAHAAGTLADGHVAVITTAMDHLAGVPGIDPGEIVEAEATLAAHAATLAPLGLARVAARLIQTLDPDGAAPDEEPGTPGDEVHLARRRAGGIDLTMRLHNAADGDTVIEVLDTLSRPAGPDDIRTLAHRRAEAMKDLFATAVSPTGIATDAQQEPPAQGPGLWDQSPWTDDGQGPADDAEVGAANEPAAPVAPGAGRAVSGRALLAVTMDLDWLRNRLGHGLLDSQYAVHPHTARRLACDAAVIPTVLGTRSEPLDVGRLAYTVPESLRRALHHRDGGCAFPGCTRRPRRCHAHHLVHWIDGGPTSLDNIRPCE